MHQLEALAEQEASIVPFQPQTIGPAVGTIPCIHAQMLETRRGLEAPQRIVPPLVTGTGTDLYLPGYLVNMVALIADAVLPEPLLGKEPAQGIVGFPAMPALDVVAVVALELASENMAPVTMASLGGGFDVEVTFLRLGILQFQRQIRPTIPDPVLDDRLGLHQ